MQTLIKKTDRGYELHLIVQTEKVATVSSLEEAEAKPKTYNQPHYSMPPEPPPVPTPEPATVTLFFAGFLMLVNRRKNGGNPLCKT